MKCRVVLLLILVAGIASCKKTTAGGEPAGPVYDRIVETDHTNGCINRIYMPVNAVDTFSFTEWTRINNLFLSNGIFHSNYHYTRTYTIGSNIAVHVTQYSNDLPVFNSDLNYSFTNDIYNGYFSGYISHGTTLNTVPSLKLATVRLLFYNDIDQLDHRGAFFSDSCFVAEFGYYNINQDQPPANERLVKAWRVKTSRFREYPYAYYQDSAGARIYYTNGIVSWH